MADENLKFFYREMTTEDLVIAKGRLIEELGFVRHSHPRRRQRIQFCETRIAMIDEILAEPARQVEQMRGGR